VEVQHEIPELLVIPFSSGRAPCRRIEDGGALAGSAWLCATRCRMGEARGGGARACGLLGHAAFIGAWAEVAWARTPRRPAVARCPGHGRLGQMGLSGPGGRAGADLGRAFGLGPVR
jgi:hypothetical protein